MAESNTHLSDSIITIVTYGSQDVEAALSLLQFMEKSASVESYLNVWSLPTAAEHFNINRASAAKAMAWLPGKYCSLNQTIDKTTKSLSATTLGCVDSTYNMRPFDNYKTTITTTDDAITAEYLTNNESKALIVFDLADSSAASIKNSLIAAATTANIPLIMVSKSIANFKFDNSTRYAAILNDASSSITGKFNVYQIPSPAYALLRLANGSQSNNLIQKNLSDISTCIYNVQAKNCLTNAIVPSGINEPLSRSYIYENYFIGCASSQILDASGYHWPICSVALRSSSSTTQLDSWDELRFWSKDGTLLEDGGVLKSASYIKFADALSAVPNLDTDLNTWLIIKQSDSFCNKDTDGNYEYKIKYKSNTPRMIAYLICKACDFLID